MRKVLTLILATMVIGGCSRSGDAPEATNPVTDHGDSVVEAPADYVFTNGRIYTVDASNPWAEAVAVRGNEIAYVGDNVGAADFVGEGTHEGDLDGRLVLPGFIESHIHSTLGAATTSGLILETTDTIEDVLGKVEAYAAENPDLPVIFGASYLSSLFRCERAQQGGPRRNRT